MICVAATTTMHAHAGIAASRSCRRSSRRAPDRRVVLVKASPSVVVSHDEAFLDELFSGEDFLDEPGVAP